jgi:transcriptional regulator with XRE-family HTH domain
MSAIDLAAVLRAVRRDGDLSQRQLAERASVPVSTVARIESGAITEPRFRTVERLVKAAGAEISIRTGTDDGSVPEAVPHEQLTDAAGRHYPAHLDVWESYPLLDRDGDILPPGTIVNTFKTDRGMRDYYRDREAPAAAVTIHLHELAAGRAWTWTAHSNDHTIGRLTAQVWPHPVRPPEPYKTAVLCCLTMESDWYGRGVERRLFDAMDSELAQNDHAVVVTLAYPGPYGGYLGNYGFHPMVGGLRLFKLRARPGMKRLPEESGAGVSQS